MILYILAQIQQYIIQMRMESKWKILPVLPSGLFFPVWMLNKIKTKLQS